MRTGSWFAWYFGDVYMTVLQEICYAFMYVSDINLHNFKVHNCKLQKQEFVKIVFLLCMHIDIV